MTLFVSRFKRSAVMSSRVLAPSAPDFGRCCLGSGIHPTPHLTCMGVCRNGSCELELGDQPVERLGVRRQLLGGGSDLLG